MVIKNTPEHPLTEQARDLFEALLDDSLAELRLNAQTLHPQRLLVIFLTVLTPNEREIMVNGEYTLNEVDSSQSSFSSARSADVLKQTSQVHALLSARQWSHRFLQRIRHTVLLLNL